ncbi:MAG: ABC transporter permease [Rufibacter sp.]
MIKHLFTLIWNRKRSNFLLLTEIFFSFLVLFGLCSLLFFYVHNARKPLGFDTESVWTLSVSTYPTPDSVVRPTMELLVQHLKSLPEVEEAAIGTWNVPYGQSSNVTGFEYKGRSENANKMVVHNLEFDKVMNLNLLEGRWFTKEDAASGKYPIVITRDLKEKMFGSESALGKTVDAQREKNTIIGVVEAYRYQGEFTSDFGGYFHYEAVADTSEHLETEVYIKVKPGVTAASEEKIAKAAAAVVKDWSLDLSQLKDAQASYRKQMLIPLIVLGIVCLFLISNVALGLFGVLWYNINRRYAEIGLRRAIGATSGQIRNQFVGEVVVLTTFGVLLGLLLAVQFPALHVFQDPYSMLYVPNIVYWQGIGLAAAFIFLLATICALYPSRQAAKIQPAVALHEE